MKRYLITGASRGIGRAIAEKLAANDVQLLLHGRDTVALAEVCDSINDRCARVVRLIHDLAVPSGISDLIDQVGKNPVDLLVNNAGIAIVKPFCEITSIEWEQTVGVNITAPFLLMQHFAPHMPPGSSIVNILSIAANTGFANWSAYCMSKFALDGLLTMRARRIAGAENPSDQRLPSRGRHEHLESDRGKVAASQNDFARRGCQRRGVRALSPRGRHLGEYSISSLAGNL